MFILQRKYSIDCFFIFILPHTELLDFDLECYNTITVSLSGVAEKKINELYAVKIC